MALWEWIESARELLQNFQNGMFPELGTWSYVLLAILVATEGPLSTLIGASASAAGLLDWRWVLVATIAGNIAGDCIWYSVGYMGKMQWLYDHGRWIGIRPPQVERLEREMRTHARKLIIFAKIAYGLIVPTLVAAGMARVPWRKWFPVVFVVETLWSILLVVVGYHTTALIQDFEHTLHVLGGAVAAAVALFVLFRFLRKRIDEQELVLDPLNQTPPVPPLPLTLTASEVAAIHNAVASNGSQTANNDTGGSDKLVNVEGCQQSDAQNGVAPKEMPEQQTVR